MTHGGERFFADAAIGLRGHETQAGLLGHIAALSAEASALPDVGISLLERNRVVAMAGTSAIADTGEQAQGDLREGPGIASIRDATPVMVTDLRVEPRFPSWAGRMMGFPVSSVFSIPFTAASRGSAALTVYAGHPSAFTETVVMALGTLAAHAAVALDAHRVEHQLSAAAESNHIIGQAQGMLMERYGLDADRAFDVLRRYSQNSNIKLIDVARQVVLTRSLPDF